MTTAWKILSFTLVSLLALTSCKMDRSAAQGDLVGTMRGPELLFFRENSQQIQLQDHLGDLVLEASRWGYVGVVKYLYSLQADVNLVDATGYSPLLHAARQGNIPLLRFLIEQAGADIRTRNKQKQTALMIAAQGGFEEACRYLIDRGANTNAQSAHGATVLMYAVASGKPSLVKLCLDRGASPSVRDEGGRNALDYAVDPETTALLTDLGLTNQTN